jgi:protein TonB
VATTLPQPGSDLQRWLLCGAIVLCAHAVGIAALMQWREPIGVGDFGRDAVTLELMPEQVQGEVTPDKPIDKVIEEKTAPLPQEESDVTLPAKLPDPVVQPKPAENPAPDAVTRARQQAQLRAGVQTWHSEIARILEHNKRYPPDARARRQQGVTEISFRIDRAGHVLESRIVKGSGFPALDAESLDLLQRAQPFPTPPTQLEGDTFSFTVPVSFTIR